MSVYHTNMDSFVFHINTKLYTMCIFSHAGPPRWVDALPDMGVLPNCIFFKDTTMYCSVNELNQESAILRLQTVLLSTELYLCYSWCSSIKCLFQTQQHNMPSVGIALATKQLLFWVLYANQAMRSQRDFIFYMSFQLT